MTTVFSLDFAVLLYYIYLLTELLFRICKDFIKEKSAVIFKYWFRGNKTSFDYVVVHNTVYFFTKYDIAAVVSYLVVSYVTGPYNQITHDYPYISLTVENRYNVVGQIHVMDSSFFDKAY